LQRARECFPEARPRIISDNVPQFIVKDFKEFIRLVGMTHVRTTPYCPQSKCQLIGAILSFQLRSVPNRPAG
jgi:putative transposase